MKTVALAFCLRGKARSILNGIIDIEKLKFTDRESKLEFRFGDGHLAQTYYTQLPNRKQKFSKNIPSLGADIDHLSQLAYPERTHDL